MTQLHVPEYEHLLKVRPGLSINKAPLEDELNRLWEVVEFLGALEPASLPVDLSAFGDRLASCPCDWSTFHRDPAGHPARQREVEVYVLRLLKFCARRGVDMTADVEPRRSKERSPLSHVLAAGWWMDSLAWLVETYDANVQGLCPDTIGLGVGWMSGDRLDEVGLTDYREDLERKLAVIQSAQRSRGTPSAFGRAPE